MQQLQNAWNAQQSGSSTTNYIYEILEMMMIYTQSSSTFTYDNGEHYLTNSMAYGEVPTIASAPLYHVPTTWVVRTYTTYTAMTLSAEPYIDISAVEFASLMKYLSSIS